jgi:hypothetical protein
MITGMWSDDTANSILTQGMILLERHQASVGIDGYEIIVAVPGNLYVLGKLVSFCQSRSAEGLAKLHTSHPVSSRRLRSPNAFNIADINLRH